MSEAAGLVFVSPRHYRVDREIPDSPFWLPDRFFEGKTVVIIGGGPSLAGLNIDILACRPFIAINSACRKVRPVATAEHILLFQDNSWAEHYQDLIEDWPGPVITSNRNAKARLGGLVQRIDVTAIAEELRAFPDFAFASSGHVAACLAAIMGARRLILVGFECGLVDGRSHAMPDYQQHDIPAFRERFLPGWDGLAPIFERRGVDVINATPRSAIACFRSMGFDEALGLP